MFVLFLFFAFLYYFHKYYETKRSQKRIFDKLSFLWIENQKLKTRLKELQTYKNDVSRTFKILDTELVLINEQLRQQNIIQNEPLTFDLDENAITLMTPQILTNLIENMNQEDPQQEIVIDYAEQQSPIQQPEQPELVEQSEEPEQSEQSEQSEKPELVDQSINQISQLEDLQLHPFSKNIGELFSIN